MTFLNCLEEKVEISVSTVDALSTDPYEFRFSSAGFDQTIELKETYVFETALAKQYCNVDQYKITCEHTHTEVFELTSPTLTTSVTTSVYQESLPV